MVDLGLLSPQTQFPEPFESTSRPPFLSPSCLSARSCATTPPPVRYPVVAPIAVGEHAAVLLYLSRTRSPERRRPSLLQKYARQSLSKPLGRLALMATMGGLSRRHLLPLRFPLTSTSSQVNRFTGTARAREQHGPNATCIGHTSSKQQWRNVAAPHSIPWTP